ncbi:SpaA isopeptide-forming pilin-related protein [Streptomyces sp. NPDC029044]|uniref:MSCRAMM family protein n=1 Tax=Streptomyces sp. NPDC029044 TaxID=3157198 RepID=UPI0034008FB0
MHARLVRSAAALVVAAAGTLTWAPVASAEPSEPSPSASAETPAPDAGSVEITTKDTAGDALPGAVFLLLDSAGQEAGRGTTDAQGKLIFSDLAPGVYRLKETASGSPLHEVVADQDVVTPGATTRLTITDPFKAAKVLLQAKDDKTGKLLAGSTVNIGSGDKTLLMLTTGSDGTASGKLPINSRTGNEFWVRQVKAPSGYDIHKPAKEFTAKPGAPVTVIVTNAKTATTPPPTEKPAGKPTEKPTTKPTEKPSDRPSPGQHGEDEDVPVPSASGTPTADETASSTAAPAPAGSLAHTGADATPWLIGGAGVLMAAGAGALAMARRRRTDNSTDDGSA